MKHIKRWLPLDAKYKPAELAKWGFTLDYRSSTGEEIYAHAGLKMTLRLDYGVWHLLA